MSEKFEKFSQYYSADNRKFVFLTKKEIDRLMFCARSNYTKFMFKRYENVLITDPWFYFSSHIDRKKEFSLIGFYRDCIFDYNGPLEFPKIEGIEEKRLSKERYVIISPYAGSMNPIEEKSWISIISELNKRNYSVYCNVTPEQQPIDGSIPLTCSLEDLYNYCKNAEMFIGLRSGVMDFIISSGITIIAIYNGKYQNLYSLKAWEQNNKIVEINYSKPDALMSSFVEALNEC